MSPVRAADAHRTHIFGGPWDGGWRWSCSCGRAAVARRLNKGAVRRAGLRHAHRANRREARRG